MQPLRKGQMDKHTSKQAHKHKSTQAHKQTRIVISRPSPQYLGTRLKLVFPFKPSFLLLSLPLLPILLLLLLFLFFL